MSDMSNLAAESIQVATSQASASQARDLELLRKRVGSETDVAAREQKLREACQGFEAIFMKQIWKQMRATVPEGDLLHSREEKQYRDMYDNELMTKLSKSGGIGLGDMLFNQLRREIDKAGHGITPAGVGVSRTSGYQESQSSPAADTATRLDVSG